jgi:hypothetical protein
MGEIRNNLEVEGYIKMDLSENNTNQWQPFLNTTANIMPPYLVEISRRVKKKNCTIVTR